MRFRKITAAVLLWGVICLAACSTKEKETIELLEPVNAKMETALCMRTDLSESDIYDGTVIPTVEELSFGVGGYLYDIFVTPGEKVSKGDILAGLTGEFYYEIIDLTDKIDETEKQNAAQFAKLENELEIARLNGGDTEEAALKLRHQEEQAELQLTQMKERLEELEAEDIGYVYITAPYDTTVVAVTNTRNSDYMRPDASVVAIDSKKKPTVTCEYTNDAVIKGVKNCYCLVRGQRYELENVPYTKAELKVMSTNGVTPVSRFRIESDADGVYVGDYACVVIEKSSRENVLAVPVNAVYSDSNGKFVYEVVDGGRVRRDVVTGISDSVYTEILEGIEEGTCVYVKN